RKDGMVKVRGYRIETSEVENAVLEDMRIREAAVVKRGEAEQGHLVCYYESPEESPVEELRERLRSKLPGYMVPSGYIRLDEMPHTANGKIDRKALSAMEPSGETKLIGLRERRLENEEPSGELEHFLAELWKELLGIEQLDIHDNFFSLGGDSFQVTRMHAAIEARYPGRLKTVDVFTHPTIHRLSMFLTPSKEEQQLDEEERIRQELIKLFGDMDRGVVDEAEVVKKLSEMEV
ncbi:phosphopantetheine-binding protein, partial [Paenibacillus sp.]|uniref:phosphopantetheine-binding protein n=1 Tax=Paenibacillus sp. TaxID=58172 RepID=UPI00282C25A8